ncbi:MAG: universal stress protein [Alphaproteobacteria bacterium]|nr:universal stress protein [Alphaproteobacteria bacterium]
MSLKNILVHVDDGAHCAQRVTAAAALAAAHDAHLVGLYVITPPYIPGYMSVQLGPEFYEAQRQRAREAADAAAERFEAQAAKAGVSSEWRLAEGLVAMTLSHHARYADLTVLSQVDTREAPAGGTNGLPEDVILDAGRPILLIPYAGTFETIGSRVLVAWNASRESARAVNDAMPLLTAAQQVTVMNINPEQSDEEDGDLPGADLALHLARHGVPAEAAPSFGKDLEVGDILLSRAADLRADLIVMGAYGHSRLRELVLGGASRAILEHMTVPVLMSH